MNPTCTQCGGVLTPGAEVCPFCGAPTPFGVASRHRAQEEERAWQAQDRMDKRRDELEGKARLEKTAQTGFLWSIAAIVLCCLPGPQVMALVYYAKSRALAVRLGVPTPVKANAALAVGIASMLLGSAFLGWAFVRSNELQKKADARVAILEKQVALTAAAPALDQPTACALAETYVLQHGFEKTAGHNFVTFECNGRLSQDPERAILEDFRFISDSNSKKSEINVCFKRGAKWFVGTIGKGICAGGPIGGAAPSATASAAPTGPAPVDAGTKPPSKTPPKPAPKRK